MTNENVNSFREYRLIDGNWRRIKPTKLIGYCHCGRHPGYLTAPILREHDCIAKGCLHLEKYEDRTFWIQLNKETEKAEKAKSKHVSSLSEIRSRLINPDEKLEQLTRTAQQICNEKAFPIIITNISHKSGAETDYEYVINYVSDDLYDDWRAYFELALTLGKNCGGKYTLRHVRHPDGGYASVDDWYSRRRK